MLVLYAPVDEAFARGYLAAALGLPLEPAASDDNSANDGNGLGLALSSRELSARPVAELARLVTSSRLILPVLTPAFLADPWLQLSDELASHNAASDEDLSRGVIPLLLAECEAPLHLRANVTLDFRQPADWDDELARLRATLEQPVAPPVTLPCPYPGMRPFRADDAAYFHGRADEIDDVIQRLAAGTRELYVLGPSGSGKSSLVAAGVIPRLLAAPPRPLLVRAMRPGAYPVHALLTALSGTLSAASSATGALPTAANPGAVSDALAALLLAQPAAELLVFIDQAEELFSQASAAAQRDFALALRALRAEPRVRLVFTVRADFFAELLASHLWIEGSKQHLDLSPMRGEMLRQAIEQPARQLHVHFEPALIDRLLADAADEPGALPLLQETLVHLWSRRRQRLLSLDEYRAMGRDGRSGLATALAARADQTMAALPRAQQVIARRVLLRMVAFGDGHPHTRRRQPRAALRGDEPAASFDAALRALADSRLVILDRDGDLAGEAGVRAELCHDMLITAWPSFARWVEARRSDEQRRRHLQDHAAAWVARGRGSSGLFDAAELAIALAWRHSEAARELGESAELTALIAASHHALGEERRRHLRRVRTAIGGLTLFAIVSLLLTLWAVLERGEAQLRGVQAMANEQVALQQRRRSEAMLVAQYQDSGRRLLLEGHPERAVPFFTAAREGAAAMTLTPWLDADETAQQRNLRYLFRAASANRPRFIVEQPGKIGALEIDGEAGYFATADEVGTVQLWSLSSGMPLTTPLHHPSSLRGLLHSPDGKRLAALCSDGSLHLWQLGGTTPVERVIPQGAPITVFAFSPDGRMLATSTEQGAVRLWDLTTNTPLGKYLEHGRQIHALRFSPDGARLAAISYHTDAVWLWQLGPRPTVEQLGDGLFNVADVTFSPDSQRLAIVYSGSTVSSVHQLGQLPRGASRITYLNHDEPILQLAFHGEDLILIAEHSITLRFGTPDAIILLPPGPLQKVTLTEGSPLIFAWSQNSMLRAWDLQSGQRVVDLEMPVSTERGVISRRGDYALFSPDRDRATLWQLAITPQRTISVGLDTLGVAFSPDGALLASTSFGGIRLWRSDTGAPLAVMGPRRDSIPRHLRFSPAGDRVAVLGWDRELDLCRVAELTCRGLARGWQDPDKLPFDAVIPMDFSPDGKLLAAALNSDEVQLWDPILERRLGPPISHSRRAPDAKRTGIASVQFSPDGAVVLIAGDDGTASVWDAASRKLITRVRHPDEVELTSAVWSPDGQRFATTSRDGSARLWSARTSRALASLDHEGELIGATFSPDGKMIATYGKDAAVRLWSGTTGAPLRTLRLDDWVFRLAFTPDSARFVTATSHGVQLWDANTGEPLSPPMVHTRPGVGKFPRSAADVGDTRRMEERAQSVRELMISPDGKWLITLGVRTEAHLWDLSLDEGTLSDWQYVSRRNPFSLPVAEAQP